MEHQTTAASSESSVTWETLEAWARRKIQAFLQALLEEEVTAVLGRRKSSAGRPSIAAPAIGTATASPAA